MDLLAVADLASLIIGRPPRLAALDTLQDLVRRLRARSIALYCFALDEKLSLELDCGGDGEAITRAQEMWASRDASARSVVSGNAILAHVARHEGWLVFADGIDPRSVDLETLVGFAGIVAALLSKSRATGDGDPSADDTLKAIKRDELVATLALYEWNIARTARAMDVTRKTIYDRMAKYQIPRQRVPK